MRDKQEILRGLYLKEKSYVQRGGYTMFENTYHVDIYNDNEHGLASDLL
jgi:hypothetical protein